MPVPRGAKRDARRLNGCSDVRAKQTHCLATNQAGNDRSLLQVSALPGLDMLCPTAYISAIDISTVVRLELDEREDPGVRTVYRTVAAHPGQSQRRTEAWIRDHAGRRARHRPADGCRHPLRGTRPARGAGPDRTSATGRPAPALPAHRG